MKLYRPLILLASHKPVVMEIVKFLCLLFFKESRLVVADGLQGTDFYGFVGR